MTTMRKTLLAALAALTTLALTAATATAQIHIEGEEPDNEHCGTAALVVHDVTGGCHVEFESDEDIALQAFNASTGAWFTILNCEWHLEGQIGENGEGYITSITLTPPDGPVPCTRAACDEADTTQIPWEVHIEEESPGVEHVETRFCLRQAAASPGTAGTTCHIILPFRALNSTHQYEAGLHNTPTSCESPAGVRIIGHLISDSSDGPEHIGTEGMEVIH